MKANVNIEFCGKKVVVKDLEEEAKFVWKDAGKKIKDIKELDLYYKPEEGTCYYVVNGTETGSFPVEGK
ncbi:MAG TPA: hypothetical protein IAB62_13520 [Candidatus Coprocola pullicola]|nr:hypothetical protein [Candidatus Coprocola pullicola]